MFPRLIIAAIVLFAVMSLMRKFRARKKAPPRALEGKTVQCRFCSVYFPSEEAIVVNDELYCCEEHARSDGQ